MKTNNIFRLKALATAVAAAMAPAAFAADEPDPELLELTKPTSTIEGGMGYASDSSRRFGQYNGMTSSGLYLLFDVDYRRRNDETGTWYQLYGRNLGLQSREIRFDHYRQG